jgi:heme exporter protein D
MVFSFAFIVDSLALLGLFLIGVGIIVILGLAIRSLFIQKKVRTEIMARLEREEEDRLAEVKATMTPAEWEAYKLQLENNKLLKDIKRRSSQKSTTTTSYGFTEGV